MQEFLKERGEYQRNCFVEIDKVKIHFENILVDVSCVCILNEFFLMLLFNSAEVFNKGELS